MAKLATMPALLIAAVDDLVMRMTVSDADDPALRLLRCRHTPSSRSVAPCRRSARRRCSDTTAPTVEWQTDVNPHRHLVSCEG